MTVFHKKVVVGAETVVSPGGVVAACLVAATSTATTTRTTAAVVPSPALSAALPGPVWELGLLLLGGDVETSHVLLGVEEEEVNLDPGVGGVQVLPDRFHEVGAEGKVQRVVADNAHRLQVQLGGLAVGNAVGHGEDPVLQRPQVRLRDLAVKPVVRDINKQVLHLLDILHHL